jgi:hypothetical protein
VPSREPWGQPSALMQPLRRLAVFSSSARTSQVVGASVHGCLVGGDDRLSVASPPPSGEGYGGLSLGLWGFSAVSPADAAPVQGGQHIALLGVASALAGVHGKGDVEAHTVDLREGAAASQLHVQSDGLHMGLAFCLGYGVYLVELVTFTASLTVLASVLGSVLCCTVWAIHSVAIIASVTVLASVLGLVPCCTAWAIGDAAGHEAVGACSWTQWSQSAPAGTLFVASSMHVVSFGCFGLGLHQWLLRVLCRSRRGPRFRLQPVTPRDTGGGAGQDAGWRPAAGSGGMLPGPVRVPALPFALQSLAAAAPRPELSQSAAGEGLGDAAAAASGQELLRGEFS